MSAPVAPVDIDCQDLFHKLRISTEKRGGTGLVYDERCLLHKCDESHVEQPARMENTFKLLESSGVSQRCVRVSAREATYEELLKAGGIVAKRQLDKYERMTTRLLKSKTENQCEYLDGDTYFNQHSLMAARLSIGGVNDLAAKVMSGALRNGFALVRPPGHHSDNRSASGFCLFNTVGHAVQMLRANYPCAKVAIVDFDLHAANGTQNMFYRDPSVLLFSIHRSDNGQYYPGTGDHMECGEKEGKGFTINVPLNETDMGDQEYIMVFKTVLLPVLGEFKPDFVFVSAGMDCAHNDPIGGDMHVSTAGFAHMTSLLMGALRDTHGRLVMVLEGGYNLHAVANATKACIEVLLGDAPPPLPEPNWFIEEEEEFSESSKAVRIRELERKRSIFTRDLANIISVQQRFWTCLS